MLETTQMLEGCQIQQPYSQGVQEGPTGICHFVPPKENHHPYKCLLLIALKANVLKF